MPSDATVLIVGGGLGGLTLAVLLEKAGIEYEVYERATAVRPLGGAIALTSNVLPMFDQIGLLPLVHANSRPVATVMGFDERLKRTRTVDYSELKERTGYEGRVISRPLLYDILLSQVPTHKFFLGKKVLSIQQNQEGVLVRCSDGSTKSADILVGADGAYSGVRQSLYKQLSAKNLLPKADERDLQFDCVCLVGQAGPLDPTEFPYMNLPSSRFESITGENNPYSWLTFTMPNNHICWMVIEHLFSDHTRNGDAFRNSEWGPEAAGVMCDQVRKLPIPSGANKTLGDLIDKTPKELISKVQLETQFFETWHGGRTVLVGDACHKMYPSAALGGVSAMQDSIVLANTIYAMQANTPEEVTKAFQAYKRERYPLAKQAFDTSKRFQQLIAKRWINNVVRYFMSMAPQWVWRRVFDKLYGHRPQVSFLPLVLEKGTVKAFPQRSLHLHRPDVDHGVSTI